MSGRPSWDLYFMRLAVLAASRSTCLRRHVGAVIVKDRMVLSTGYNDTPRGLPNCGEGGCARCASAAPSGVALDTCLCLHAEQNSIIQAAYHGVAIVGATIYTTHQPCLTCAKMIVNAGIRRIVFAGDYPDPLAREMLEQAGVTLDRISLESAPAGQ
ncbi:MAG: cytidine/deoxycytidylate deaminase family protein [Armatimonadota bacterium]|nr:cytidine/deoxycytidylate deaminase family protein [Armatimonadota bacterium]MDR7451133.1 cytidine/deoxycytidylate deaminase family protein [Armatimonadota bacterium]MDR7467262.1 cytidine/deoxycytidylate deaminase family protein [Armatimonadota bacterium]MDR7494523.1 cytidine/deoxycytidylate deaminase family protein [Armatimonadota bacterium]MDR7499900.1 cytidine/deoxycytidylate deaminase family protein [Armatimonadota bacterium]